MALATSVTGTGKLISKSVIGSGSYTYNTTAIESSVDVVKSHTISYTETRETRKWYALTESAATTYQAANPSSNPQVDMVDPVTGAYELTTETRSRTIVSHAVADITEAT